MKLHSNPHGFTVIEILIVVLGAVLISSTAWYVYHGRQVKVTVSQPAKSTFLKPSQPLQPVTDQATLTGTVTTGPTSPVCKNGDSCSSVVTGRTVEAKDASGLVVSTSAIDANGKYSLTLKPGHYTLSLSAKVGMGNVTSGQVDVVAGNNSLNLTVDSGIR